MIARLWRGWTSAEDAHAYERFLLTEFFPSLRDISGFRGAEVLRRPDSTGVASVTVTRFETLEAVKAFGGDDNETPVLEPEGLALLSRYEERAQHFEIASFTT